MPTSTDTLKKVPREVLGKIVGFLDINSIILNRLVSKSFDAAATNYCFLETEADHHYPVVVNARSHSLNDLFSCRNNQLVALKILLAIVNGKNKLEIQVSRAGSLFPPRIAPVAWIEIDVTAYRSDDGNVDRKKILVLSNHIESLANHKSKIDLQPNFTSFVIAIGVFSATIALIVYLKHKMGALLNATYPSAIAQSCSSTSYKDIVVARCEKTIKCGDTNSSSIPFNLTKLCESLLCSTSNDEPYQPVNATGLFAVCYNATTPGLTALMVFSAAISLAMALFALHFVVSRACRNGIVYIPSKKPFTLCDKVSTFFNRMCVKKSNDGLTDALLEAGNYGALNADPR